MKTLTKIIAGATLLASAACNPSEETIIPSNHSTRTIEQSAPLEERLEIGKNLVDAVIFAESNGNPNASRYESHINDTSYGLMQILTGTARTLSRRHPDLPSLDLNGDGNITQEEIKDSLLNPETNVLFGTALLNDGLDKYGTLELAVASYNSGLVAPQNALVQSGLNKIYSLYLKTDGAIGKNSRSAVRRFQKDQGLEVDGIPGKNTKLRLREVYSEMFPELEVPSGVIPSNGITENYVVKVMGHYNASLQKTDLALNTE